MGQKQEAVIREFLSAWGDGVRAPDIDKLASMLAPEGYWELYIPGGPIIRGPDALRAEIQRLRADLTRGVGNNLNQLVQGMHLRRQAEDAEDGREVAHRLRGIADEVAAIRRDAGALLRRVEPARRRRDR